LQDKVAAYLGFAQRAKKLVSGDSAAEAILNQGRARLIIIAEDASPRTRKNFCFRAGEEGIPVLVLGTKAVLGSIIGRSPRSVLVVTDQHFADSILKVYDRNHY